MSVISLAFYSIKNYSIRSYREKVLTVLVEPCPITRKHFLQPFQHYCPTSNAFSESVSNPNHTKSISKLKGIKCWIRKFNNYTSLSYTETAMAQLAPALHTNFKLIFYKISAILNLTITINSTPLHHNPAATSNSNITNNSPLSFQKKLILSL
jgi:hypothetical protein